MNSYNFKNTVTINWGEPGTTLFANDPHAYMFRSNQSQKYLYMQSDWISDVVWISEKSENVFLRLLTPHNFMVADRLHHKTTGMDNYGTRHEKYLV